MINLLIIATIFLVNVNSVQLSDIENLGCYRTQSYNATCEFQREDVQEKFDNKQMRAIAYALQFLREHPPENLPMLSSDIIQTFVLAHYINDGDKCTKNLNLEKDVLLKEIGEPNSLSGGKLAKILIGLRATCHNSLKMSQLVNILKRKMTKFPQGVFNNFYQLSLAMIALYVNHEDVPSIYGEKLLRGVFIGKKRFQRLDKKHVSDTESMGIMALSTLLHQKFTSHWVRKHAHREVKKAQLKLEKVMLHTENDNLVTLSLMLQASLATKLTLRKQDYCGRILKSFLQRQKTDGSFGSVQETLYALIALNGRSILDVKHTKCPMMIETTDEHSYRHFMNKYQKHKGMKKEERRKVKKKLYDIEVIISSHLNKKEEIDMMKVNSVPSTYTALDILQDAAKVNSCFQHKTKATSWGKYLINMCNIEINHTKRAYWMFYVNGKMADVAVDKYQVKNGDTIEFVYSVLKK